MSTIDCEPRSLVRLNVRAAVLSSLPAWALFLTLNAGLIRWLLRGAGRFGLREWATMVASILAPFGAALNVGYDWVPHPPMMGFVAVAVLTPLTTLGLYGAISSQWTVGGLRRMAWVCAGWVMLSVAVNYGTAGVFGGVWDSQLETGWVIGRAIGRIVLAAPYLLGWVVLGCPWIVSKVAEARPRGVRERRQPTDEGA